MNKSGTFEAAQSGFEEIDADLIRAMVSNSAHFILILDADLVVERVCLGTETLGSDQFEESSCRSAGRPT